MSVFNQWPWIFLLHNLPNNAECIETLASWIAHHENFRQIMFIWYVLLVKDIEEACILKYILLGGRIADIARTPYPEKHILVRKLLTWAFYAVGRRSSTKTLHDRLRRLLNIWQDNNVHGYEWSQAMIKAYSGDHPNALSVPDVKLDFGNIVEPCAIENGIEASKIIDHPPEYQGNKLMHKDYVEQKVSHIYTGKGTDGPHNLDHYKLQKPCFKFELTTDLICSLLNIDSLKASVESYMSSGEDGSSNSSQGDFECDDIWTDMKGEGVNELKFNRMRDRKRTYSSTCCSSISSTSRSTCSDSNCTCSRGSITSNSDSEGIKCHLDCNSRSKKCWCPNSKNGKKLGEAIGFMEPNRPPPLSPLPTITTTTTTSVELNMVTPQLNSTPSAGIKRPKMITPKSRGKDMNTIKAAYAKSPVDVKFSDDSSDDEGDIAAKKSHLDSPRPKRSGKNMEILIEYLYDSTTMEAN